jgi:heavy metal efflux system protein
MKTAASFIILYITASAIHAQQITPAEAIRIALEKHPSMAAAQLETARLSTLEKTAFDLPKAEASLLYGQYNSIQKNDNNLTVIQTIPFPTWFATQKALNKAVTRSALLAESVTKNELAFQVHQVVNQYLYLQSRNELLQRHDSILTDLVRIATVRFHTGEGTKLALHTTEMQLKELKNIRSRNETDIQINLEQLRLLCQSPWINGVVANLEDIESFHLDSLNLVSNPSLAFNEQQVEVARRYKKVETARAMPDLRIGYFNQTLIGTQNINGQDQYLWTWQTLSGNSGWCIIPALDCPLWSSYQGCCNGNGSSKKKNRVGKIEFDPATCPGFAGAQQEPDEPSIL